MTDIVVQPSETVLIKLAAAMTGHTVKALERKIARGVLAEDIHFHRHDGNIYIDMPAFQRLVRKEPGHGQGRRRG